MEKKRNSGKSSPGRGRKSYSDDKSKRSFKKSDNKTFEKKSFHDKPKWASKKVDEDFDFSEWEDKPAKGAKNAQEEDTYFNKRNERAGAKKGVALFQKSKESFIYKSKKPKKEEDSSEYGNKRWEKKSVKFQGKPFRRNLKKKDAEKEDDGTIRLNKYIANTGICSRREADDLIKIGAVSVNGKIVTEMGYKVKPGDSVNYGGQTIRQEREVYILLNKPKDYITTVDDPQKRKTVLELIKGACKERVYPVGRLDRNTTGLLLLTNDGELTKKLTHPSLGVKKIYHVVTDKSVSKQDIIKLKEGFRLDDGFIKADNAAYVDTAESKKEIGIEMHSGKNRIVRRMMEHLGYKVVKLDRVVFAGLTKKDLPRGRWRFLTEKEIGMLKMIH